MLDTLYPPRCGICKELGPQPICTECQRKFKPLPAERDAPDPLAQICACYLYEGSAERAIQELKFRSATILAEPLAQILHGKAMRELAGKFDVVVPVPIARVRRAERGFNQSELLCGAFPRDMVSPHMLRRTRYTRPQVGLARQVRLRQLENAFAAQNVPPNTKILLVDDVVTSGGTAIECARVLLAAGATEVRLLTLASQPMS